MVSQGVYLVEDGGCVSWVLENWGVGVKCDGFVGIVMGRGIVCSWGKAWGGADLVVLGDGVSESSGGVRLEGIVTCIGEEVVNESAVR